MTENIVVPDITDSASKSIDSIFRDFSFEEVVEDIVRGTFSISSGGLFKNLLGLFLGELKTSFALVGSIAALMLLGALINNLSDSVGKSPVEDAGGFAVFVYIATICAVAFERASSFVFGTLEDITVFVHSIIPAISALCVTSGETALATMSHPVIFFVCSAFSMLIRKVITPLVLLRVVCSLLCAITSNDGLAEFTGLFSKFHKTLLTFSMSLFAGILGISSFAATSFDNLAARGIKFAVSSAVPVVGGSISEAMSSVASSAMLLKSAVGLGGVMMLFAIVALPLLKVWALSLSFRLVAAFTAPVAEKRAVDAVRNISDCLDMLFSSLACIGTIMIIALASIL